MRKAKLLSLTLSIVLGLGGVTAEARSRHPFRHARHHRHRMAPHRHARSERTFPVTKGQSDIRINSVGQVVGPK